MEKINSNQKWNNDKCWSECKNPKEHNISTKNDIWNPSTCIWENVEYLASIIDDSVIICDEIIIVADSVSTNVTSTVLANFDNKKVRYKMDYYILDTVLSAIIIQNIS